ncbi:hypothetical protein J2Z66_000766 [Paenibacillus eucommiae]|uniref:Uncharacterized protein n=1 Tax=Paenibacillus eucommiae TaxID=1355755 RepID=A0ABS4IQJ3_9BACL|nr:hypothetical protein [Paenibacillus eucommiae]
MAVGGRAIASAFKDLFHPTFISIQGNKSLTAAGAHSHSLHNHLRHEHAPQRTPQGIFFMLKCNLQGGKVYPYIEG